MSSVVVASTGQISLGDVGRPPGHIMPEYYGIIVSTSFFNVETLNRIATKIRNQIPHDLKLTSNLGLVKTYPLTAIDTSAGWYTTMSIATDISRVFGAATSLAVEISERSTAAAAPAAAPVVPHVIGEYSSWVPISGVFSDFRTQSTNLLDSLTNNAETTNPAPYMTALDTNINAIRDAVKIKQLQALNAQNIQSATDLVEDVTDMSDTLKKNRDQAQLLKQQISLSTNQTEDYKKKLMPLQILAATLAIVLVVYILIGAVLPSNVSSIIALVLLAGGFGASVYFAVVNKQN